MKNKFDVPYFKEMPRGIVKIVILSYIKKTKTYPYAMLKHMKKHNHFMASLVSKSDIYNMTTALEKEGFITSKAVLKGNKVQKIYTITAKGEKVVRNKDKIFMSAVKAFKKLVKEEFNE